MLSCLMIVLKNKHKPKDVSRELGKALNCTWEETTLGFPGVLSANSLCIRLLVMLPPLKRAVLAGEENLRRRKEELLVKSFFFHGSTAGLVLGNVV